VSLLKPKSQCQVVGELVLRSVKEIVGIWVVSIEKFAAGNGAFEASKPIQKSSVYISR